MFQKKGVEIAGREWCHGSVVRGLAAEDCDLNKPPTRDAFLGVFGAAPYMQNTTAYTVLCMFVDREGTPEDMQ